MLSEFIVGLHQNPNQAEQSSVASIDPAHIRSYLSLAKKFKPRLTPEAGALLRTYYKQLRSRDKSMMTSSYNVTVRQLEAMIRIAEAYARLHLDLKVREEHVQEAYHLLNCSILKVEKAQLELEPEGEGMARHFETMSIQQTGRELADETRAARKITLSHEEYNELKLATLGFFKELAFRRTDGSIEEEYDASQDSIVSYLLSTHFEGRRMNS